MIDERFFEDHPERKDLPEEAIAGSAVYAAWQLRQAFARLGTELRETVGIEKLMKRLGRRLNRERDD